MIAFSIPTAAHTHLRNTLTQFALPSDCYLSDVVVYEIDDSGAPAPNHADHTDAIAKRCVESGLVCIDNQAESLPPGIAAMMAIPIYRDESTQSIVVFAARDADESHADPIGVFEVWEPIGPYEEVALSAGFFGKMERFQNVSSFVRFEKGSGLPGSVWQNRRAQVQDDLANHPGFLRAAGASADLLQSAVGIPVANEAYCGTAILISSAVTPVARGIEVWELDDELFKLTSRAYTNVEEAFELAIGSTVDRDAGVLGQTLEHGKPLLFEDVASLMLSRPDSMAMPCPTAGLAMPFFQGESLTSITLFLF